MLCDAARGCISWQGLVFFAPEAETMKYPLFFDLLVHAHIKNCHSFSNIVLSHSLGY